MKNSLLKRLYFLSIIAALTLTGCEEVDIEKGVPECMKESIESFSKSSLTCDSGAKVNEYTFQNKTVYVFDPGICRTDQSSEVVDSDCNSLGSVGGWSGGIINGEDFSKANFIRTVWKN